MPIQAAWFIVAIAGIAGGIAVVRLTSAWLRFRGARVITCPENLRPAGVHLDGRRAAFSALAGTPSLRLSECSRWPERQGCGQECLAEIEASPEACLVRNILTAWYRGKSCACCGVPLGEIRWAVQKPGLITADKRTVDWSRIPAEHLPEILASALPVCFACHMANTLVREHPDLALDRGALGARRIST